MHRHAACTLLLKEVTPSLTRPREIDDVVDEIDEMDSWLALRSRERFVPSRASVGARGVLFILLALGGAWWPGRSFDTFETGAKSPNIGLHWKYLE